MPNLLDGAGAELPASYGNLALMRIAATLRDREANLKEEAKAARERAAPQGQMVDGHYIKPSIGQHLTPMGEDILAQFKQKGLLADQTGYDVLEGNSVQAHMRQRPADDAPQSAKLAWAQQGAQIPALRSMMTITPRTSS